MTTIFSRKKPGVTVRLLAAPPSDLLERGGRYHLRDCTVDGLGRASPVTPYQLGEAAFRLPTSHGDDLCPRDALFVIGALQQDLDDTLQVLGPGPRHR